MLYMVTSQAKYSNCVQRDQITVRHCIRCAPWCSMRVQHGGAAWGCSMGVQHGGAAHAACHNNGSVSPATHPGYVSMSLTCFHVAFKQCPGKPACNTCHSDGANEGPQEGGSQGHRVTGSMGHVAGHRGGHSCQAHQGMETCHHLRQLCDGHAAGQVGPQSAPSPHGPCDIFSKAFDTREQENITAMVSFGNDCNVCMLSHLIQA